MHRFVLFAAIALLLAGCGGGSKAAPKPPANKAYTDPTFGFSLKYPASWSLPKAGGHYTTVSAAKTYVLPFGIPGGSANAEVTISGISNFPPFGEGKISPDPNGGPDFYHYHHITVDNIPAVRVERWSGNQIDEIDTFVNTSKYGYDIRMDTGLPPFDASQTNGYNTVLRTLKLPFS